MYIQCNLSHYKPLSLIPQWCSSVLCNGQADSVASQTLPPILRQNGMKNPLFVNIGSRTEVMQTALMDH